MNDNSEAAVAAIMAEDLGLLPSGSQCTGVTVSQAIDAAQNFVFAFNAWEDEDVQAEMGVALASSLTDVSRAQLIFNLLTYQSTSEARLNDADKHLAVDLAETIGPDRAQWLYHFAVFVTKAA